MSVTPSTSATGRESAGPVSTEELTPDGMPRLSLNTADRCGRNMPRRGHLKTATDRVHGWASGASSVQSWKSEGSAFSSYGSLHEMHRDAAHRSGPSQFNVGPAPDTASTSANVLVIGITVTVHRESGERGAVAQGVRFDRRTARLLREKGFRSGKRNGSHHRRSVAGAWGDRRRRRSHGAVGNKPRDALPPRAPPRANGVPQPYCRRNCS